MFSVSLSTLSTERERREGGLAVPTGTLAFSGDSGTRAKLGKKQKVVQTIFRPIPFSRAPTYFFPIKWWNCILQSVRILNVYLTNFLWWGEKTKKILLKVCCTTAFLLFWETAAARGGHLEINTEMRRMHGQLHWGCKRIMPEPKLCDRSQCHCLCSSPYINIYISVLCFHFIMFLQMFLSGLTVAMIWS